MAGPWEDYQPQAQRPPWEDYKATRAMPVDYQGNAPLPMDDASRMARVKQSFQEKQAAAKAAEPGFFDKLKQAGQAGVEDLGRSLLGVYKSLDPTQASSALEAGAAPIMAGLISTPPGAASVVAGEATRKAAELSGVDPWLQAAAGTAASIAVPGGAIPRRVIGGLARPQASPARTVQDLMPQARPGLPPPESQLALPAPARAVLPEPANMVMEAGQLQTPGGATMPGPITRVPPRNIVDLVDEIKKDVKQTVIDDIFEELRTGATGAMPRRQAPSALPAPRRMQAEQAATSELMQDFAPKAPAIELPPPERPKIIMGQQGYRGEATETKPVREPGPAVARKEFTPIESLIRQKPSVRAAPTLPERQPAKLPDLEASTIQPAAYAGSADAERLTNIVQTPAFAEQGLSGLDVPTQREVLSTVVRAIQDPQVRDVVVKSVPVDVVDKLTRIQAPANVRLHRGNVIVDTPSVDLTTPITMPVNTANTLISDIAASGTKQGLRPLAPIGTLRNEPPTLGARQLQAGTTRQPPAPVRAVEEARPTFTRIAGETETAPGTGGFHKESIAAIPEAGQPPTPKRTPLDILKEETGALKLPRREDPMAALRPEHEMGSAELARKSFTTRGSKIFEQMGPTGKKMGEDLADAYFAGHQRRAKLDVEIDKIFDKYPGVEDTLLARIHGGGGKGTQAEAAAFRELKRLSDIPGDEAVALKVKVKNPITGVEREFKKQRIYAPKLIDPAKVSKNPTRLVDQVMEELIADGIEPGAARTQATQIVRNMSKKSGSLQFMRTSPVFDPDIHMTNAREAYKRALGGEVERLEVLKRFGKVDKAGLLGDEIGGIRERTANISAEAGPEAAQKAELWATRQIGMQRGEIDTVQKKAGELMRNFNTLKLGFMPVTNLAAQMPMILAAGRTTRFNPIKSFDLIRKSFGKTGEGAEMAKLFGTAIDNHSADLLQKFETARSGPGGKTAAAFLHYTGGLKSENFIAKLASQVGNEEAKHVIQKLIDNPTSKSAQNTIRRYGLDPAKVIQEGATESNIFRIGRKFSDEVLLRGNVLDLPPAFTSESGKVFFQFKRATQVLGQQMYDAAKNDPSKLIALLAASQIGGEALLDIKGAARGTVAALVSGDPKKITDELKLRPQGVRRILDNWAAALSFGYFGDTVMDIAEGKNPKNLISGSTVAASPLESSLHVVQGAGKIARGEKGGGKQMVGGLLREVPGGTYLRGLTRPEKSPRQKLLEDLGLSKMLKENRAAQKEIKEQLGLD